MESEFGRNSENIKSKVSILDTLSTVLNLGGGALGPLVAEYGLQGGVANKLRRKLNSIEKFYKDLKGELDQTSTNIGETKTKLKKEITTIGELKVQTAASKTYADLEDVPELRSAVIVEAERLISQCNKNRQIHNGFAGRKYIPKHWSLAKQKKYFD